jgi:hypothetical protein
VGESDDEDKLEKLPKSWPNHLDKAVKALNHCILPTLKFSPKELLLGIAINTPKSELEHAIREPTTEEAAIHMAYAAQQQLDGYEATVKHAITRKRAFDKWVLKSSGEVIFKKGQLVQVYQSNLDQTLKTERKLLPKWSHPHRVRRRIWNAYKLETQEGTEIKGEFSARCLCAFTPRPGSQLEKDQEKWIEENKDQLQEDEMEETDDEIEKDAVGTPLFAEGEHGIGEREPVGQEDEIR